MEEILDIFDEDMNPIGQATKKEAHFKGYRHRSAHIWIYNDKSEVLLQKRSLQKDSYPWLWDISAAGHINAWETVEIGALRELREELWIDVSLGNLEEIITRKSTSSKPEKNRFNNEFQTLYLYKYNGSIDSLIMQPGEVDELRRVPIEKFIKEVSNPDTVALHVNHKKPYYDILIEALENKITRQ